MSLSLSLSACILGGLLAIPRVSAIADSDADDMFNSFNSVFLSTSGNTAQYGTSVSDSTPDLTWAASLDILVAEDAFDRTGSSDRKNLVGNLLNTWLSATPPPWDWDGWNDDIGWFTLALIRGYQITGTQNFLDQAKYGFDFAFSRGWDTQYNGGGIWEEQPEDVAKENPPGTPGKEALSNDSLGKVAALIFQSTQDQDYLAKAEQIYGWVRSNLFDTDSGLVKTKVDESGNVDGSSAAYNQGTFLDFANLMWKITWNSTYYDDAQKALDYGKSNIANSNGIFSNSASYLHTWADEMARGAGNFVSDNGLWDTYFDWFNTNANAILSNRRSDKGITWNGWDEATPNDDSLITNAFASAVAWLQYTPAVKPSNVSGIHIITNKATGLAIDSAGNRTAGAGVVQWGKNPGPNQRWQITQSPDFSWMLMNLDTWLVLDCPNGQGDNGLQLDIWPSSRADNQRWWIDQQNDGTYKIWNKASSKALDGNGSSDNGSGLIQNDWTGADSQRWNIVAP